MKVNIWLLDYLDNMVDHKWYNIKIILRQGPHKNRIFLPQLPHVALCIYSILYVILCKSNINPTPWRYVLCEHCLIFVKKCFSNFLLFLIINRLDQMLLSHITIEMLEFFMQLIILFHIYHSVMVNRVYVLMNGLGDEMMYKFVSIFIYSFY